MKQFWVFSVPILLVGAMLSGAVMSLGAGPMRESGAMVMYAGVFLSIIYGVILALNTVISFFLPPKDRNDQSAR